VLLAVEVADASLAYDRQVKRPLYAEAGVPEYWVLDVGAAVIERYTGPRADGYSHMDRLRSGDSLTLVALPDVAIELAELLE
jgi:Uma2 family endonuclease